MSTINQSTKTNEKFFDLFLYSEENNKTVSNLPDDLWCVISSYLPTKHDVLCLSGTNRFFQFTTWNESYWAPIVFHMDSPHVFTASFQKYKCCCIADLKRRAESRVEGLRGTNGFNGLIHEAWEKFKTAEKSSKEMTENFWGPYQTQLSDDPWLFARLTNSTNYKSCDTADEEQKKTKKAYNTLVAELNNLIVWNESHEVVGGKVYELGKWFEQLK